MWGSFIPVFPHLEFLAAKTLQIRYLMPPMENAFEGCKFWKEFILSLPLLKQGENNGRNYEFSVDFSKRPYYCGLRGISFLSCFLCSSDVSCFLETLESYIHPLWRSKDFSKVNADSRRIRYTLKTLSGSKSPIHPYRLYSIQCVPESDNLFDFY